MKHSNVQEHPDEEKNMKLCYGCMTPLSDEIEVCPNCGYIQSEVPELPYFLDPGTIIANRYYLGKVIGHGGFGITYLGFDLMLQRVIAVKEFFPGGLVTRQPGMTQISVYSGTLSEAYRKNLKSFLDEARQLARVQYVNGIVKVYDCVIENGTGYIVMEYLKGETYRDILAREKTLETAQVKEVALQVLRTLKSIHALGIIHRDISPDNLFRRDDGTVCLIDFGAARFASSVANQDLTVLLKRGYAPEEQYLPDGKQGPWTDIYAVGATMYKMLTGSRPDDSFARRIQDSLVPPSQLGIPVSPGFEKALMKSLQVRAEDRYQSVDPFILDLEMEQEAAAEPEPEREPKREPERESEKEPEREPEKELPPQNGNRRSSSSAGRSSSTAAGCFVVVLMAAVLYLTAGQLSGIQTLKNKLFPNIFRPKIEKFFSGTDNLGLLLADHSLWVAGTNRNGALNNADLKDSGSFVKVMEDVEYASFSSEYAAVLKDDNTLWFSGMNLEGQQGNGETQETVSFKYKPSLDEVATVSCGYNSTVVTKLDGSVYTFGKNDSGQLGTGDTQIYAKPFQITGIPQIIKAVSGWKEIAFLQSSGDLWTCGRNDSGQLGNGSTNDRSSPVLIAHDVRDVSVGWKMLAFIKKDDTLWLCGRNDLGQLGDGTTEAKIVPTMIMEDVKQVYTGFKWIAVLKNDSTLWTCGLNDFGQLGNGTYQNQPALVRIADNVASLAEGHNGKILFFMKKNGSLWTCGMNSSGALGDGTYQSQSVPLKIKVPK